MRTIFVVGGTWETLPWGQCEPIVKSLNSDIWNPVWIPYPAKYAGRSGYMQSYTTGKKNLWQQINDTDDNFVLLGYSQGAKIAGDIAQALSRSIDKRFLRAYLIADPERHTDDQVVGPAVSGEGVYGQRRVGYKCRQFAHPNDIVCANTNPVFTNMAGATAMMCLQHPLAWLRNAGTQDWPRINRQTVVDIKDFIKSQVHVSYNTYTVSNGLTVPEWIIKDMETL